jgi:tetratricopeptide (TPR) repeat protein
MWWLALLAFADWSAVEKMLVTGQYRAALAQLEQAKERPASWHVLASKAYDGLNDPAQAVKEAEAALALEPGSEPAHVQLGGIFLSHNTPAAALDIFTEAQELFPRSLVLRLGKGLALKELQRYDEAERDLAGCWPNAVAFDALATVYLHRLKFGEAKDLAARFIAANPDDCRGYYFLAAAKDGLQENGARELAGESLRRKPDFAASHALLGKLLLREGELEAAVRSFEQAIRYRPDLTQAHLQLAQAYKKLGRDADAAREFAVVRELKDKEAQPVPALRYHRGPNRLDQK